MGSGLLERDLLQSSWLVPDITVKPKGRAGSTSRDSGSEITATTGAKDGQSQPWPECFSEGVWSMQEGMRECSACQSSQTCSASFKGSPPMLPVPG